MAFVSVYIKANKKGNVIPPFLTTLLGSVLPPSTQCVFESNESDEQIFTKKN